ncbi:MAG: tRNA (adenosine(37)-N6)-dimethylallyltransferase MiaA [Hyphomicrobiaceae bacterium]|nr:tRNA (adenosine(37)-N6)-dimethylallyltransferase MiaA [Hyphomicrobiaceae bacterium]
MATGRKRRGGMRQAVLIAGPTASGKSALALRMAAERDAVIVNADSMQVYDGLQVLTARPGPDDMARAQHRLYGFVPPAERFSTGRYAAAVSNLVADVAPDRTLIFVGGTGLYFEALTKGFTNAPEVDPAIVARWNDAVAGLDEDGRRSLLAQHDPAMAARLKVADPQRVVRALSVREETGRSLADWQNEGHAPVLAGFALERFVVNPDRDVLRSRIRARFEAMLDEGAVDEVAALMSMNLDPDLPAMKAIGVREIAAWQAGELSRDEAVERAVIASAQYAKRQRTWFRHHMADWEWRTG